MGRYTQTCAGRACPWCVSEERESVATSRAMGKKKEAAADGSAPPKAKKAKKGAAKDDANADDDAQQPDAQLDAEDDLSKRDDPSVGVPIVVIHPGSTNLRIGLASSPAPRENGCDPRRKGVSRISTAAAPRWRGSCVKHAQPRTACVAARSVARSASFAAVTPAGVSFSS